jgi:hypothetical protein
VARRHTHTTQRETAPLCVFAQTLFKIVSLNVNAEAHMRPATPQKKNRERESDVHVVFGIRTVFGATRFVTAVLFVARPGVMGGSEDAVCTSAGTIGDLVSRGTVLAAAVDFAGNRVFVGARTAACVALVSTWRVLVPRTVGNGNAGMSEDGEKDGSGTPPEADAGAGAGVGERREGTEPRAAEDMRRFFWADDVVATAAAAVAWVDETGASAR